MKLRLLNLLSAAVAVASLMCFGMSFRSVRYVGGQYLPTHNGKFALLALSLAVLFVLVRARARKSRREDPRGFESTPAEVGCVNVLMFVKV